MEHIRIAMYDIQEGTTDDLAASVRRDLVRTLREQSGSLRDHLVRLSDRRFVSITFWDSRDAADAAIGIAGDWVRDTVADRVDLSWPELRLAVRSDDAPAAI